ncbi:MAG: cellulase family glycosylhydrolase [Planctomycetota bacterium]
MHFCRSVLKSATLFAALMALLISLVPVTAEAAPGRARVINGNVRTADDKPLRVAPWFMDTWHYNDFNNNRGTYRNYFNNLKGYGINCVRICPWMGAYDRNLATDTNTRNQYLDIIKTVVGWAAQEDMYVIVNCHTQFHATWNYNIVRNFWDEALKTSNYSNGLNLANQTHVIFELTNEPQPNQAKGDYQRLYNFVRGKAPNTHFILASHFKADDQGFNRNDLASLNVDWSKTSYGFHAYDWPNNNGNINPNSMNYAVNEFRNNGYPIICTEMFSLEDPDNLPMNFNNIGENIENAEDLNMSWAVWAPRANYQAIGNGNDQFNQYHDQIKFDSRFTNELSSRGIDLNNTSGGGNAGGGNNGGGDNGGGNNGGGSATFPGPLKLTNQWKQWNVDVQGTWDWAGIIIKPANGSNNQKWDLVPVSGTSDVYRIKHTPTGKYLTSQNANEWSQVLLAPLNTGWWSQMWVVSDAGGGNYRLKNRWTNYYLSCQGDNGGDVYQAGLRSNWSSQKWKFPQ